MIKVNTEAVRIAAMQIDSYNSSNRKNFDAVQRAVNTLSHSWQSHAATRSQYAFDSMKRGCENGYNEINDLTRYLRDVVGISYEQTEASISAAAEEFR